MVKLNFSDSTRRKFLAKVGVGSENDCWEWLRYRCKDGYGKVTFRGSLWFAHRLSYLLFNGLIPPECEVMHSCDNRACVNPGHLSCGIHRVNMRDAALRGRMGHRNSGYAPRLLEKQVEQLRLRYKEIPNYTILAGEFGISQTHASRIIRGLARKKVNWRFG